MKKSIIKFLEFNGKAILFKSIDGNYWVALKPICEALSLEWTRQFKNAQKDKMLGQLLAKQPMVGADNRVRNMVALQEKYIYGWLFSISSESQALQEYRMECYELLYNHFHGTITRRAELLHTKAEQIAREQELIEKLQGTPEFLELAKIDKSKKVTNRLLQNLDREMVNSQLNLFATPS